MDAKTVEALAAKFEQLSTVKKLLASRSPTWTFFVGATHKDGNQFEQIDVPQKLAKEVLVVAEDDLETQIRKLGGSV